ncbi:hypothetical protein Gpo141_00004096 [Globisporangium polare]
MRGGLDGASRAIVERWSALLQPWGPYMKLVEHVFTDFPYLSVNIGTEATKRPWRENVQRCRETLELLVLIALVETAVGPERASPLPPTRRCVIHGYNTSAIADVRCGEVYKAFFLAFDESSQRDEFRDTMEQIFRYLPVETRCGVASEWRIQAETWLATGRQGQSLSVEYFTSALEMVKGIGRCASEADATLLPQDDSADEMATQWRYRYPYVDVSLDLILTKTTPELGTAPLIAELLARGVNFEGEINIGSSSPLGRFPVSMLGPVLHAITDKESMCASEGYERIFQWEKTGMSLVDWDVTSGYRARSLQAVCSSLAAHKGLEELSLSGFDGDSVRKCRQKVLQWLLYALFSHESASCITSLTITSLTLDDEEMSSIIGVLTAKHPVKLLLDGVCLQDEGESDEAEKDTDGEVSDDDETEDPGFAVVEAGAMISVSPIDDDDRQFESALESFTLKQDGRFRVMRNDSSSGWVDVIVPHYGYCIVPRASVARFEAVAPTTTTQSSAMTPRGYSGLLTSLELNKCSHVALLPLLQFIGSKLLSLNVTGKVDPLFLRGALAACPNLTKLVVVGPEEQIEFAIMEAYMKGRCKLQSVRINDYLQDREESLIVFFHMLKDTRSAAAKRLRRLELEAAMNHRFSENVYRALAQTLRVNRTIEWVRIRMCETHFPTHAPALMQTNHTPVASRPLCLESRLAFLSVLQRLSPDQSTTEPPPRKRARHTEEASDAVKLGSFDPALISSVFAFAAERVFRHVHIDSEPLPY